MSILARNQLLDDLAGPQPRPAPVSQQVQRAHEPLTLRGLMRRRLASIFVAAAYVLWVALYFYAFQGG